ncbi:MAG: hypothetical protein PQ975_11730 [Methanobacterium sp.]
MLIISNSDNFKIDGLEIVNKMKSRRKFAEFSGNQKSTIFENRRKSKIFEASKILRIFESRRNNVYKVKFRETSLPAVMKVYSKKNNLLNEYKNLKKLSKAGLNVPELLFKSESCLILEHIPGNLVNDLTERQDLGSWIEELANWMTKLHQIKRNKKSLLKSDSNLRNFIFKGRDIYGLDFEEMRYGDPREDLADICFFLLTNFPSFTNQKKIMIERFLDAYKKYGDTKLDNMEYFISKSAEEIMERRRNHRKSCNF